MFTLDQVNEVHDKFGKAGNLAEYARELKGIGVLSYDSFVSDGHTVFFGEKGHMVETPANHKEFIVADWFDAELFQRVLKHANKGKISYEDMAKELAKAGVEK